MKHTREQLDGMSDFEVSKTLCNLIGYDVSGVTEESNMMTGAVPELSDWHYIMPLAVEHDITYVKDQKCAHYKLTEGYDGFDWDEYFHHDNPQRAIACCLIMVLEANQP
jgi:hypothetical protein